MAAASRAARPTSLGSRRPFRPGRGKLVWPSACTPLHVTNAGEQAMRDTRRGETMKLGAFFHPTGNHVAAWLHPDAQIDAGTNFRHYAEITRTAERGKF